MDDGSGKRQRDIRIEKGERGIGQKRKERKTEASKMGKESRNNDGEIQTLVVTITGGEKLKKAERMRLTRGRMRQGKDQRLRRDKEEVKEY